MSLSVNCSQSNVVKPNFRGSYQRTENGTPYYKTNSGVVAGSILGGFLSLGVINHFMKKRTSYGFISLATALASVGCGAIIDNIRNKNAAKAADEIRRNGLRNAMQINEHIDIGRQGTGYYESNDGAKHGWKLGAAVSLVLGAASTFTKSFQQEVDKELQKAGLPKNAKAGTIIFGILGSVAINALGGFIMGKIADHNANNDARKHA